MAFVLDLVAQFGHSKIMSLVLHLFVNNRLVYVHQVEQLYVSSIGKMTLMRSLLPRINSKIGSIERFNTTVSEDSPASSTVVYPSTLHPHRHGKPPARNHRHLPFHAALTGNSPAAF